MPVLEVQDGSKEQYSLALLVAQDAERAINIELKRAHCH